jgi:hypothetical protein
VLDFEHELLELRDRIAELNQEADADPNSAVARELEE